MIFSQIDAKAPARYDTFNIIFMSKMALDRDLQFIYEIGCLRYIPRAWKQFFGPDFANLAEHHLRVVWIAMLLAKHEGQGDVGKIVKMALVHDVSESRTGDVHFVSRMYTKRNEKLAIKDIFKDTALEKEMVTLWHEYEKYKSIEAQIVKDADTLDVDFELQEQEMKGVKHVKVWKDERLSRLGKKFYTTSAKKIWQAVLKSEPSDWHKHARSRVNAGDWKK